ncbi:hypothetical protein C5C52_07950 [Rathayibacter sp. AY1E5]|nr:hypothetical protein C5C52_07950 [Rathayibacter sp. AY1E5]
MSEPRDQTASTRRSRSGAHGTRRRETNPRTKPARLDQLNAGDVVMQHAYHPVAIVHIGHPRHATIRGRGRSATRTFAVYTVYCR